MARSGTYVFNPELVDHIDEAFERCGIDPADIGNRHIRSCIRSTNFMLSDWQNFGWKQFTLEFAEQTMTQATGAFVLPDGGYDIFAAYLRRDGIDQDMRQISKSDYLSIPDKLLQGRPDRYWVQRGTHSENTAASVAVYFIPENSTDEMHYYYMRRMQDAGEMTNTLDLTASYQMAFSAGLAFYLSFKFAPERTQKLRDEYLGKSYDEFKNSRPGGCLGRALSEDRETADAVLRVSFDRSQGRWGSGG